MNEHEISGPVATNQKRFEEYLENGKPDAYRLYQSLKKDARKKGEDPIIHLIKTLANGSEEKANNFRALCVQKRLIEPGDYEISLIRDELKKKDIDLDALAGVINNPRKMADLIAALNIKELERLGDTGIYLTVDRILARGTAKQPNTKPSFGILDILPAEQIDGNEIAAKLTEKYAIEERLEVFQTDFAAAQAEIEQTISESTCAKKAILQRVLDYYKEMANFKIDGIVTETIDEETGQTVQFPALHQKIAAQFILKEKKVLIADDVGLGKTAESVITKKLIEQTTGKKITAVLVVPNEVLDHWQNQIEKWNTEPQKVVVITSNNKTEALKQLDGEKPDFVIVSYDMVFRSVNGNGSETIGTRLAKIAEYAVFDEVDEAKSEDALRTTEVLQIAENAKHVALLSATPVPNSLEDIAVIGHIVSDGEIEINGFKRQIKNNPRLARTLIAPKMIRRTNTQVYGKREVETTEVSVELTPEQLVAHEKILLNEDGKGTFGLIDALRRCCLDPKLVGLNQESPKYRKIVEILFERITDPSEEGANKAVVYVADLQANVTEPLTQYLNDQGISAVRIDGQVHGKTRSDAFAQFRKGEVQVLVATLKTMGKGVEMPEANLAIFANSPLTDAEIKQGIGRLARKGQKKKVSAHILIGKGTKEERILASARQKEKWQQFMLDGVELTDEEIKCLENSSGIVKDRKDPLTTLYRMFGNMTNSAIDRIVAILQDEKIAEYIAQNYWDNFEGSFFGNTNKLCAHIINELEKSGVRTKDILDLASGPGCLARVLQKPMIICDINAKALALAKEKLGDLVNTVCASFCTLPFPNESFDIEVLSLALLHSLASEREDILRQMNGTMKKGAIAIITLPNTYSGFERMTEGLRKLGFEILVDLTGVAKSPDTSYECFVFTMTKISDSPSERVDPSYFDLKREIEAIGQGGGEFKHLQGLECSGFVIESQKIANAAIAAAEERKSLFSKETLDGLLREFGGSIERMANDPRATKRLGELDLEAVQIRRGKNPVYSIRAKDDAARRIERPNGNLPKDGPKKVTGG
ncbi:MAG: SNF2-related protein [Candidatus Micrarchaeota archaeon]|nr:SNF2-related protein [Candidatus Micrarchaeota archaeon]